MAHTNKSKTILVAPLDWGLGHATRDIPIINLLLEKGYRVLIGGEGRSLALLKEEYPHLDVIELPPYNIHYPASGSMAVAMLMQMPSLYKASAGERAILKTLVETGHVQGVISDNRFGLYSPQAPSVYITHQVRILGSKGLRWIEPPLYRFHKMVMNHYTEVWIPDVEGEPNFSGILTHSYPAPRHAHFVGAISRFRGRKLDRPAPQVDVLAILSGPEPQRTMFEEKIIKQALASDLKCLVVRGMMESAGKEELNAKVFTVNHLSSEEMLAAILNAKVVLSRPGYSTPLDLAELGKNGIYVPTPGQTEQEYNGENLAKSGLNILMSQDEFDLQRAWDMSRNLPECVPNLSTQNVLSERIDALFGDS